jgi:methyl-accepting chemotaxis protein
MLALNATIEVAHGGASDRRFLVVAEEVRKLPEQALEGALEISQRVHGMQGEAGELVATMDAQTVSSEVSVNQLESTQTALAEIREAVHQASALGQGVAGGGSEQIAEAQRVLSEWREDQSRVTADPKPDLTQSTSKEATGRLYELLEKAAARIANYKLK